MHINPQIRYSLHTPHRLLWHWRVLAGATLVFLLVLMLIFRPRGLLGTREG